MSRLHGLIAVLVFAPGIATVAHADESRSPLVEMRGAAEEQADIDPDVGLQHRPAQLPQKLHAAPTTRDALRDAMRAAVRSEVAREVAAAEPSTGGGVRGRGSSAKNNADKSQGNGSDGRGASEQARNAAIAAQQARRNSDISKSNNGKGNDGNNGNGNMGNGLGRGLGKPGRL